VKKEIFDIEVLRDLENMTIDEAKNEAMSIIEKMTKTKGAVVNRLKHDVDSAPTPSEVSRIMWQVYLSGTGFGTIGSAWKKHYSQV
jgi:hypothetical protein